MQHTCTCTTCSMHRGQCDYCMYSKTTCNVHVHVPPVACIEGSVITACSKTTCNVHVHVRCMLSVHVRCMLSYYMQ